MPLKPKTDDVAVDVKVSTDGPFPTVYLFTPGTQAAREWIDENVGGEVTWHEGSLVVEHRYARELAQGMIASGLEVR